MTSDPITIRRAVPADSDRLVGAYEWLFEPPGKRPPRWEPSVAKDRLDRLASSPSAAMLVAERDGEMVGFCSIYLDIESVRYGRRAWVEDLAVGSQHRSSGVGKRLLDEAKRWADERHATRLVLESADARTAAHRFYEREAPSWTARCFGWEL